MKPNPVKLNNRAWHECCFKRELGIIKNNSVQLNYGISNFFVPVFSTGFFHPKGETMKGDIENVPTSFETGSHAPKRKMLLKQKNASSESGKSVGCS